MVQIIGRIYKIVSSECDDCYIGSTTKQVIDCFRVHKCGYNAYLAGNYKYDSSFEVLKFADASIELIHEGLFDSRQDLAQFEGEIIRTTPNAINKNMAGRSVKQYQQDNLEQINTWRTTQNTCEICGGKYTHANRAQHCKTMKHQNAVIDSSDDYFDCS
jgi:hypothetical protein